MKIPTYLPLFTGFYESYFDASNSFIEYEVDLSESEYKEYYEELDKAGVTHKFFNENLYDYIDYIKGENGAAEYIAHSLINLDHSDIIKDVTYEKVVSPRFYNFSTDSINCTIDFDETKLMVYLLENKEALTKYIADKYTSRDGFSSSYTNEVDYWLDSENWGDHQVGSLLDFVFENNGVESIDLYYESNCEEGFSNSVEIDYTRFINDFNKKKV